MVAIHQILVRFLQLLPVSAYHNMAQQQPKTNKNKKFWVKNETEIQMIYCPFWNLLFISVIALVRSTTYGASVLNTCRQKKRKKSRLVFHVCVLYVNRHDNYRTKEAFNLRFRFYMIISPTTRTTFIFRIFSFILVL